ncbi:amino acid-binding protein [Roseobacter sp. HKCCD9010]|uniref:ABC transporter substrate-binding protein n=1 Tax=unclassified Roseobacter TaxID=196798 RepID=UPI001490C44A|nr:MULTISPECIES: glycine betaine ABC transporter substrate-binding protein [unclassified Roseobacter]MBF9050776.1 amino acid-binding protein [Rhodobacterales bacterium HKCCD4356]NNV11806.1 amino acid-binding protein [Roseobacter sp. HKCCD7357]NNV17957.1 amino acid-binding protein [Roseobacter sp. HKCCD8768]NNV26048.1 amino acid-binding protein [Roseobacter sp. HKCCD8192]NNV31684.1 amino acid-binding protein [Roseobacter sp. HKCCD9061]
MLNKTVRATLAGTAIGLASFTAASAQDLVIGVPNWPSASATANILEQVIETNFGLEVELQNGTNPIIFEAMDSGSMHVHPEVWMPNQQNLHDTFVVENGTVVMNENPVQANQGMCVPTYIAEQYDITTIEDLTDPEKMAIFDTDGDGRPQVWIGAPGWASTVIERIRARSYGYDEVLDLEEYDGTVAWGALGTAIEAEEPWIGFCYDPHFIFVAYDLTYLEEPAHDPATWNVIQPTDDPAWLENSMASTAWNGATLHLHYAANVQENYPEVAALFDAYEMPAEVLSTMGLELSINDVEPADFAAQWIADNEDIVLGWLTN